MVVVVVVVVVVTVAVVSGRNRALILRTQSKVFPIHTRSLILIFDSFCDARARRSLFYFLYVFFFLVLGYSPVCLVVFFFSFSFIFVYVSAARQFSRLRRLSFVAVAVVSLIAETRQ